MTEEQGWQLDLKGARNYEQFLVPALMDRWAAHLVEATGVHAGDRVLDLACGTGIVTRHAGRRAGQSGAVTGADVNPAMLTVAREATTDLDVATAWHEAPAERLPFPDGSFEVALCQQGLQFFADRTAALEELHRAVIPGGRVGLSTCRSIEHQPGYLALAEIVTEHLGVDAADIIRSPYALGEPEQLRHLVEKGGFGDVEVTIAIWPMRVPTPRALLEGETMSSPLGDVVDRLDTDVLETLVADLADALAPHRDDQGVAFPFETLTVTATR